jgi:hypothetical protein
MSSDNNAFANGLNDNTTPEQARQFIVNQLVPECREIGNNFFSCLEKRIATLDPKTTSYEEMEKKMGESFIPECMKTFDLDSCLNKNSK